MFPQQGDPDDPDARNLSSAQDDPDAENLSSLQGFEQLTGIYIHIHSAPVLYCFIKLPTFCAVYRIAQNFEGLNFHTQQFLKISL